MRKIDQPKLDPLSPRNYFFSTLKKMRIKLHNSMSKHHNRYFLINDQDFIYYYKDSIFCLYQIDDYLFFLSFSISTKELEKGSGFGLKHKTKNSQRFKDPHYWKEMND